MTKPTIVQIFNTLFAELTDGLVYFSTSPANDKITLLKARDLVRDAITLLEDEKPTAKDFAVRIPEREVNVRCAELADPELADWELPSSTKHTVKVEAVTVYHIHGALPTTSKICAIKAVRARTNMGLKEAKDYVDSMYPIDVSTHLSAF